MLIISKKRAKYFKSENPAHSTPYIYIYINLLDMIYDVMAGLKIYKYPLYSTIEHVFVVSWLRRSCLNSRAPGSSLPSGDSFSTLYAGTWISVRNRTVLGSFPPVSFHPCVLLRLFPPPEVSPLRVFQPWGDTSPPMLFRLVARFARVRIGDSSRNRFASTAYFAQSQTTLFPCILFMGGISRWGK